MPVRSPGPASQLRCCRTVRCSAILRNVSKERDAAERCGLQRGGRPCLLGNTRLAAASKYSQAAAGDQIETGAWPSGSAGAVEAPSGSPPVPLGQARLRSFGLQILQAHRCHRRRIARLRLLTRAARLLSPAGRRPSGQPTQSRHPLFAHPVSRPSIAKFSALRAGGGAHPRLEVSGA